MIGLSCRTATPNQTLIKKVARSEAKPAKSKRGVDWLYSVLRVALVGVFVARARRCVLILLLLFYLSVVIAFLVGGPLSF